MGQYYHLFANGDDARNFITSEEDFRAAFNRFAICAARCPKVKVLAFNIEESHPHTLVRGEYEDCIEFKTMYETSTYTYCINNRGSKDDVIFDLEMSEVCSEDYLMNAAAYVLVQPTKDGKKVMPYDYRWGTASLYFRPTGHPVLWCYDEEWNRCESRTWGELTCREKRRITHTTQDLPAHWQVCNGFVLPTNYIDVAAFESIFRSFNKFRTFMAAGKKQLQPVVDAMAATRGVNLNDLEARRLAYEVSERMFGKKDARWLEPMQRLQLAKELRFKHRLAIRQIATLTRLPELEIRKYLQ